MLKIYAVRDIKIGVYHKPFAVDHEVQAVRGFESAVTVEDTELKKYPEDFEMYQLGELDERTGLLKPFTAPEFICNAMQFTKREVKDVS